MMEHTKEPWMIEVAHLTEGALTIAHGMNRHSDGPAGTVGKFYGSSQDGRRIVACVNACAGVATNWLESEKEPILLGAPIGDRFREIEQQRDELLAALERIGGFTLSQFMGPHDMALECVNVARAAIAEVKP